MRRLAFVIALAGCYDWDALSSQIDFSGKYTIVLTNGQNGCMLGSWTVGVMSDAIPLQIQQSGRGQVDAQIGGVTGDFINFFCGSKDLIGSVTGNQMDASIMCTKDTMMNTCAFRYLAHTQATLNGNHLTGRIDYTTIITTDTADCNPIRNCTSSQTYTGNR